jgi:RimJ/RimL family protein N-acetyltransferase
MVGPQAFADGLWQGVDAQFVAVHHTTGAPVVWFVLYGLNRRDQHAKVAVHGWPAYLATPALWEGVFLGCRHAFANWPLRRLYAEVREFNLTQFASGVGTLFEVEGRLREHAFHDGHWYDQFVLTCTADRFAQVAARWGRWFDGDTAERRAAPLDGDEAPALTPGRGPASW